MEPAALILEAAVSLVLPPVNFSVPPAATEKVPELVPPPPRSNSPEVTLTVLLLLNGILMAVGPAEDATVKVPRLLKAPGPFMV